MVEAIVEAHSKFFDGLVDLVPAKHYYDADTEKINLKYEKKQARLAHKQAFKEKYKANKRQQLDPDTAITTLKLQQIKQAEASEQQADDHADTLPHVSISALTGKALTPSEREALQAKLKQRIAEKQQKRESHKSPAAEAAKSWLQSRREHTKQKLQAAQQPPHGGKRKQQSDDEQPAKKHRAEGQQRQQQQGAAQANGSAAPQLQLAFGRIEVEGEGKAPGGGKKKDKKTKAQLLAEAEARQQELKEAKASDAGQDAVRQDAWRNALARAKGEKVLDDPRLLRRSLKKDKQKRVKSAKAWQERSDSQQAQQQAKQKKRKDNLSARRQTKVDNKKNKREKKLLRPGFEGRKASFINAPSS